jgi:hypothetical protein
MWDINVFIMQIDYVKISCKEDVHICHTNFAKKMERNSHERTRLLAGGKCMENDCFLRILKFKMHSSTENPSNKVV